MSSTRRTPEGSPIHQFGFASASEFAEQRGVCGSLVAAKAELLETAEQRQLIYFLQALSLQAGGLRKVALEMAPTLIQHINVKALRLAASALRDQAKVSRMLKRAREGDFEDIEQPMEREPEESESVLIELATRALSLRCPEQTDLADYLIRLCIDPETHFRFMARAARGVPIDMLSALRAYRTEIARRSTASFVQTSVGKQVFEGLDFAKDTGQFCVIEGDPRHGKTFAAKIWCERHLGEARYVSLKGINSKGIFFRTLAQALGLPSAYAYKANQMQARVEDFLRRSKLVLVIDEAQYLWPQQDRIYSHPDMVNWCLSMCNDGVPLVFVTWAAFGERRRATEEQTGWHGGQLSGRISRYVQISTAPTRDDYLAVARHLLPEGCKTAIALVAQYANSSGFFMQGVSKVILDARYLAKKNGRDTATLDDIKRAIQDVCVPSDAAQNRAFANVPKKQKRAVASVAAAPEEIPNEAPRRVELVTREASTERHQILTV